MEIYGINTASLVQNDRLLLMAFKIRDKDNNDRMLLMQIKTLIDFLIILRSRITLVGQRIAQQGDDFKNKCITANESLVKNIPEITQAEVTQPDPGLMVMSMAPKMSDDGFSLVMALNNEHIVALEIDDLQSEFILMAVFQAIKVIDDQETLQTLGALLDFIVLYLVDLSNIDNLQYKEINHEPWKKELFSENLSVLFCFETELGKKVLIGSVIKTNVSQSSPEADSIIQRLAMLTPSIKALQDKYKNCQTFRRTIPSEGMKNLTRDQCLRALHGFCLETQENLNS